MYGRRGQPPPVYFSCLPTYFSAFLSIFKPFCLTSCLLLYPSSFLPISLPTPTSPPLTVTPFLLVFSLPVFLPVYLPSFLPPFHPSCVPSYLLGLPIDKQYIIVYLKVYALYYFFHSSDHCYGGDGWGIIFSFFPTKNPSRFPTGNTVRCTGVTLR